MRTAACLGFDLHVIEPAGFVFDDRKLKRAGMDYAEQTRLLRHTSWAAFQSARAADSGTGRLILLTTKADAELPDFAFRPNDTLLLGRESAGVPDDVHDAADVRLRLPMQPGARSLNVAVAGAVCAFEALRQLQGLPGSPNMPRTDPTGDDA